jgi:endothelin-converting enzyme/putative endopeptidase
LGGVNAAYDGLQLYLKDNKNPGLIDGSPQSNVSLSPGPQFGEPNHVMKRLKQVKTDPHSPGMYRAYVPLNVDAFYQAFDIKKGDGMYIEPDKRVKSGSFRSYKNRKAWDFLV